LTWLSYTSVGLRLRASEEGRATHPVSNIRASQAPPAQSGWTPQLAQHTSLTAPPVARVAAQPSIARVARVSCAACAALSSPHPQRKFPLPAPPTQPVPAVAVAPTTLPAYSLRPPVLPAQRAPLPPSAGTTSLTLPAHPPFTRAACAALQHLRYAVRLRPRRPHRPPTNCRLPHRPSHFSRSRLPCRSSEARSPSHSRCPRRSCRSRRSRRPRGFASSAVSPLLKDCGRAAEVESEQTFLRPSVF
jgi:hypothetical protein